MIAGLMLWNGAGSVCLFVWCLYGLPVLLGPLRAHVPRLAEGVSV